MGISEQLLFGQMNADDLAENLWAESIFDDGKAYECTRCGQWVPHWDIDLDMEICNDC